tara:strand:- start:158 stop:325 length:168 start_codon:yes stop_codon:yes gene_type:complete
MLENMVKAVKNLCLIYLVITLVNITNAAVPDAKIIGPIKGDPVGSPSRNALSKRC